MAAEFQALVAPEEVDPTDLAALYASPSATWFRANMVSTTNGVAAGPDGRSGSINNEIDREVFALLRAQADAVLVGAGTARAEGYRPTDRPLVVVTAGGAVPPNLQGAPAGSVVIATQSTAAHLGETRTQLDSDNILILGKDAVDLRALRAALIDRGWGKVLCEGGPRLLSSAISAGVMDEICLTWVPRIIGGGTQPLLTGANFDLTLKLRVLLERSGTLLGRWWI